MNKDTKKIKYLVVFQDDFYSHYRRETIDEIEAPEGYTAKQYVLDCSKNGVDLTKDEESSKTITIYLIPCIDEEPDEDNRTSICIDIFDEVDVLGEKGNVIGEEEVSRYYDEDNDIELATCDARYYNEIKADVEYEITYLHSAYIDGEYEPIAYDVKTIATFKNGKITKH